MKEVNYWQKFLETGKIDDYLYYLKQKQTKESVKEGDHSGAGFMQRYRDNIEGGTFRGI